MLNFYVTSYFRDKVWVNRKFIFFKGMSAKSIFYIFKKKLYKYLSIVLDKSNLKRFQMYTSSPNEPFREAGETDDGRCTFRHTLV